MPAFSCIAMLGQTLQHLVLLDVRITSAVALEHAIGSLPHLQVPHVCSNINQA